MISKESALRILDFIEKERRETNNASTNVKSYDDVDYRILAAKVAEKAGYSNRQEWTEELRNNPGTQFAKSGQ